MHMDEYNLVLVIWVVVNYVTGSVKALHVLHAIFGQFLDLMSSNFVMVY